MTSKEANQRNPADRVALAVGDRFVVTVEKVAHGGHFIVRHQGAVIFVRHGIPGEEVEIEITGTGSSFNRADVVEVIAPSEDRVSAPCRFAHRNGCGGCDFQHIEINAQREFKSSIVKEQFLRIGKIDLDALGFDLKVQAVEPTNGLHWRTRMDFAVGRLYVSNYFDSNAKKNAIDMVNNIKDEFKIMFNDYDWIDEVSKNAALEKVNKKMK